MESEADRRLLRRIGQESAARRRVVIARCAVCGAEIRGLKTRRYCSDACRAKAYRRRKEREMKAHAEQRPGGPDAPAATATRLTPEKVDRVLQARDALACGGVFPDAAELIRRARGAGAA